MVLFVLRRIIALIPLVLIVTAAMFLLLHVTPGDPARAAAGADAPPELVELVRERLGLDRPVHVQYADWVSGFAHGDLGTSLQLGVPVTSLIFDRLPVTLALTFTALVIALVVSLPAAMTAASHRDTGVDRSIMIGTTLGISLPEFFVGLLLVRWLSLELGLFPAVGYVSLTESPIAWLQHITLPAVALAAAVAAEMTRHLRASLREILRREYIDTASVKGLGFVRVMGKHALRNAAIPVVTVMGLQIRRLLAGTVVVERVFNIDGMGSLLVQAVFTRDLPIILGIGVVAATMVAIVNLMVDMSYGFLDPRVRFAR